MKLLKYSYIIVNTVGTDKLKIFNLFNSLLKNLSDFKKKYLLAQ